MQAIFDKISRREELSVEEAVQLLKLDTNSQEYYRLLFEANRQSREDYGNKGLIFGQIGINAEPCPIDCKFCSMGKSHYSLSGTWRKPIDEVVLGGRQLVKEGIDDLFLMTTADYPMDDFLEIGRRVRAEIPSDIKLVANIGDFDDVMAQKLINAGFTGAYHIVRLREGIDTTASPEQRIATLDAIVRNGLELYYCIEPIGKEHSPEEIAEEIFRAKKYHVNVMAAMRRVPVAGTPLENSESITVQELCKVAAVTRIVVQPKRSMNVHEVSEMSLLAGVNQLYAEAGANPRDVTDNTEKDRGYSVARVAFMLRSCGYADLRAK